MASAAQKQSFLNKIWPLANQYGSQYNIDPKLIVSQAALESNYGLSAPNNNYFGIKGPGGNQVTTEYVNGQPVSITDSFRGYASLADSVAGYAKLIGTSKRYSGVLGLGFEDAAAAVKNAGYATDPNYTNKLLGIGSTLSNATQSIAQVGKDLASGDVGKAIAGLGGTVSNVLGGIGDSVTGAASDVVDKASEATGVKGVLAWLKELFSINSGLRLAVVLIGTLLIAAAVFAFLASSPTVQKAVKTVATVA